MSGTTENVLNFRLMETKQCAHCKEIKPLSEFGINRDCKKSGLQSWCKDCCREYNILRHRYKDVGGVKICRRCNKILPKTYFYKSNGNTRDGLQPYCKDCCRETTYLSRETNEKNLKFTVESLSNMQLINELRRRGYSGELVLMSKVKI